MAAVMLGAATLAYRKAAAKTREDTRTHPETPVWLRQFAAHLPEDDSESAPTRLVEKTYHQKRRILSHSNHPYEMLAWFVYDKITRRIWFEVFIMVNILFIGVMTGLELENQNNQTQLSVISEYITMITLVVFSIEVILKVVAEGFEPLQYFKDPDNGYFNIFDFSIVFFSFVFWGGAGSTISALRMLRLIRLFTFIKNVPQLRMIIAGLLQGIKSVSYIVVLLLLVVYIFAILGCILFGDNDPVNFGSIGISMVTLFQVSTLSSWSSVAYVSWFGCEGYLASPYDDSNDRRISSMAGSFQGFKCVTDKASPFLTGIYFSLYILVTAWVIMSIFIGVISMGMFENYMLFKDESHMKAHIDTQAQNTMPEVAANKIAKTKNGQVKVLGFWFSRKHFWFLNQETVGKNRYKTLKEKIELVLDDAPSTAEAPDTSYQKFVAICLEIKLSKSFLIWVTLTIVLVGLISGIDTNHTLRCNRLQFRYDENVKYLDDDSSKSVFSNLNDKVSDCGDTPLVIEIVFILAQVVFTCEAVIKIGAEGTEPLNYFLDEEDGTWNCIDFLIVVVGFIELTPAHFLFANFPVVILRMLRLLRVFRLAKALPRLRAIVGALMSSFASVGWVCVLICVFNYIMGCFCMMLFMSNDPFHFGSVSRAMFTILRIETLDTWDQVMLIAMYGCRKYPAGYEFMSESDHLASTCQHSQSFGFYGVPVFFFVAIVGAYVLPTVLIGIVSIKFDKTSKLIETIKSEKIDFKRHLKLCQAALPDFFTTERVDDVKDLFTTLDADKEKTLELGEIAPFFQYALDYFFDVQLSPDQLESLFFLLDSNHTTEIGLGEFMTLICVLKQMKTKTSIDPNYAKRVFNQTPSDQDTEKTFKDPKTRSIILHENHIEMVEMKEESGREDKKKEQSKWDRAMHRVDQESLDSAQNAILTSINGTPGKDLSDKIKNLFKDLDSDKSGEIDRDELGEGLLSVGIRLNFRQLISLMNLIDIDGSGTINLHEFLVQVSNAMTEREKEKLRREANERKNSRPSVFGRQIRPTSQRLSMATPPRTPIQSRPKTPPTVPPLLPLPPPALTSSVSSFFGDIAESTMTQFFETATHDIEKDEPNKADGGAPSSPSKIVSGVFPTEESHRNLQLREQVRKLQDENFILKHEVNCFKEEEALRLMNQSPKSKVKTVAEFEQALLHASQIGTETTKPVGTRL